MDIPTNTELINFDNDKIKKFTDSVKYLFLKAFRFFVNKKYRKTGCSAIDSRLVKSILEKRS